MAIVGLDHVQIAAPPGCERDARRFYGGVLGLAELPKPAALADRGADYDAAWPERFAAEAERIRGALGGRAVVLEHAGSTSVPGMAAKPILDIVLGVPDATAEGDYVPALEAAGYVLRMRDPGWHEHRLLERHEPKVNLHVFPAGAPEIARMLRFRDLLRSSPEAFDLYLSTKRSLAERTWRRVQDYADAKHAVVAEILGEG